jgi:DNA-binding cell septation regulator SpoVG
MSYSALDEIKMMEEPIKKHNPRHSGKPHSPQARKKIANAMKARYRKLREAAQSTITEDKMRIIIRETLDEYLAKNGIPVTNNNKPNIPL